MRYWTRRGASSGGPVSGPAVLETLTYRLRGHSVADAGLSYRSKEEIAQHEARDPIGRLRATLIEADVPR